MIEFTSFIYIFYLKINSHARLTPKVKNISLTEHEKVVKRFDDKI